MLKSHPDKLLVEHLKEVSQIALDSLKGKEINFPFPSLDKQLLSKIIYITAAFHDFGKGTVFFQYHLGNREEKYFVPELKKYYNNKTYSQHALISAIFVLFVLNNSLNDVEIDENLRNALLTFSYLAIKRHHGSLGNLENELSLSREQKEILKIQVKAFHKTEIQELIKYLIPEENIKFEDFEEFILSGKYEEVLTNLFEWSLDFEFLEAEEKINYVMLFVLIYAVLLYSDKSDVILNEEQSLNEIDILEKIENFRERNGFNKPKEPINKIKNKAYYETLENTEKIFDKDHYLYSISLPTGLGKTILSLAVAEKIRELASLKGSIVINIPFTSIIDQNFEVFKQIVETDNSSVLLKHHHLAEPKYKVDENSSLDYEKSSFLIETWHSNIIATTFVQLLETLFKVDKTKIIKIPNLINSVVVLDEIQTVDYEYWNVIRLIFNAFSRIFNTYFVLVTATQPFIFAPDKEIKELVPNHKEYFSVFSRTQLINKGKITQEEFEDFCLEFLEQNQNKDTLIILNTKDITLNFFKFLRDNLEHEFEIFYLTTLITPYERKRIIDRIKQNTGKQKIIVSTQLVEAGVDISVDTVIRQLAPLDSIIQAAGRANRYNENLRISDVYIFEIEEWIRKSNLVYGSELINKTKNVLANFDKKIQEKDFHKLISKYFETVYNDLAQVTYHKVLKTLMNFEFEENNKWQLIESVKHKSLYVLLNGEARQTWKQFLEIYNTDLEPIKKKARFSEIKPTFYNYVVNVPIPFGEKDIMIDAEEVAGFYVVDPEITEFYNYNENDFSQNTGYHKPELLSY